MKAFIITALSTAALCMVMPVHASPPTVNAEQMDLDVDILSTIGKEKSKRNNFGIADGVKASQSKGGDCGSVNINSNNNADKKSNSGIKEMFGKQSTTVVTGPVINTANCK